MEAPLRKISVLLNTNILYRLFITTILSKLLHQKRYEFLKFIFIFLFFIISCENPIERKKRELENCKLSVIETDILKFQLISFPPIPKVHLLIKTEVENTNDDSVTIQKFFFKVLKPTGKNNDLIQVARVSSTEELEIPPLSKKELNLEVFTTLEENLDNSTYILIMELARSAMKNEEINLVLDGNIEYRTFLGVINVPYQSNFKTKLK